jgi:hypothetical protein
LTAVKLLTVFLFLGVIMRHIFFHICVSGFTQDRGYYHGILRLREALVDAGHADGKTGRVWYETWTANWGMVAADLSQVCITHGYIPVVTVSGYSYGGYGAINVCKELALRGIDVQVLNLCDPVGRRWWWPRPLPAITSMLSRDMAFTLPIPGNVLIVNEFFQKTNRPQGHRIKLTDGTKRGVYVQLDRTHQRMDDAPEFHECVLREAARVKEAFKGDQ